MTAYYDQIDFGNHDGTDPTFGFRSFDVKYNFYDYDNQVPEYWLMLQENDYETYDSWFPQ